MRLLFGSSILSFFLFFAFLAFNTFAAECVPNRPCAQASVSPEANNYNATTPPSQINKGPLIPKANRTPTPAPKRVTKIEVDGREVSLSQIQNSGVPVNLSNKTTDGRYKVLVTVFYNTGGVNSFYLYFNHRPTSNQQSGKPSSSSTTANKRTPAPTAFGNISKSTLPPKPTFTPIPLTSCRQQGLSCNTSGHSSTLCCSGLTCFQGTCVTSQVLPTKAPICQGNGGFCNYGSDCCSPYSCKLIPGNTQQKRCTN